MNCQICNHNEAEYLFINAKRVCPKCYGKIKLKLRLKRRAQKQERKFHSKLVEFHRLSELKA